MEKKDFYKRMREEVKEYAKGRSDSAAFLIWFLVNFFRLEIQDAIDSVCDQKNDKGIDGIYIEDDSEEIYIFQSKYSPKNNRRQGDKDIRNFVGASAWFENENTIHQLINSTASQEIKSLIDRVKIIDKTNYSITLIFLTNKKFNNDALEYISAVNNIESYDAENLYQKYTYFAEDEIKFPSIDLYLNNSERIKYNLPDGIISTVYAISAIELIKLEGIRNRTLFYKNVRYGVGNTRVNKSIKDTILDSEEHRYFFLYHNGITILCEELEEDLQNNKITLSSYAVINGCQSMLTFFENKENLTKNIYIPVKIIQTKLTSHLVDNITYFANNQNSISLKDLRSNTSVQRALQTEFNELFNGKILYRRKRGENETGYDDIIDKDFAAQIYLSIYLREPHNTHLKNNIFGQNYSKIFSRHISAEKIYLGKIIYEIVKKNASKLTNEQIQDYSLSLFFFAFVISEILREDELGKRILLEPKKFITEDIEVLKEALYTLWNLIVIDINYTIEDQIIDQNNFFDYKNLFRNSTFVEKIAGLIKKDYTKMVWRKSSDAFSAIYKNIEEKQNPKNSSC